MKRLTFFLILALAAVTAANAQVGTSQMINTGHDLSTGSTFGATSDVDRICVFCHTPHQAAAANGQDPLWNHELSAVANYGVYSSATMNATPTELGGAVAGSAAISNLCLSCHDGTVGVGTLYNDPNELGGAAPTITDGGNVVAGLITGNPNLGNDLTNDHPVNFTYDTALATADGELYDPAATPQTAALLFAGNVECASCHDPHDNTFQPFMVMDNTNSALCVTCHVK